MTKRRPTADGVIAAAKRIAGSVTRTPILPFLHDGATVWVKAESLQQGGSFKLRGATNRMMQLTGDERVRGVVAFSSGNHALGVAMAAQRLGVAATIVMPSDAPDVKRRATLAAGATIVDYDRRRESREEIAGRLAAERGAVVIPSFDDVDVIEGQGSVGVELDEQMRMLAGGPPERVIVPCGGGGLASGIALAIPGAEIVIAEPEGWDDMRVSLEAGEILPVPDNAPATSCDALQTPRVSPLTFDVLRARGARAVFVGEADVARAVAHAMRHLRIVAEPGGAIALAALLAGKTGPVAARTALVISGGNVDPERYAGIIKDQAAEIAR